MKNSQANGFLTARELSRLLNVHINTVRRWHDKGILKAYRIGPRGDRRFKKSDVDLFIAESAEITRKLSDEAPARHGSK